MHSLSKAKKAFFSAVLIASALAWIAIVLRGNTDQLFKSLTFFEPLHVGVSIVPAIISIYIAAYIYFLILSRTARPMPSFRQSILHFIISQVVRHIPGKIWGVLYQVQATEKWIKAGYTVQANIEHYILLNLNSIAIAASVFAYYRLGIMPATGVFFIFVFPIFLALKKSLFQQLASLVRLKSGGERPPIALSKSRDDIFIIGLLQMDWFFYFFTCALVLPSRFSIEDTVVVAACYAMAWLAGALATVLPGGIFVREASFVWLSGIFGFEPPDMFAFSIVARILFTLADVASAALIMILLYRNSGEEA